MGHSESWGKGTSGWAEQGKGCESGKDSVQAGGTKQTPMKMYDSKPGREVKEEGARLQSGNAGLEGHGEELRFDSMGS